MNKELKRSSNLACTKHAQIDVNCYSSESSIISFLADRSRPGRSTSRSTTIASESLATATSVLVASLSLEGLGLRLVLVVVASLSVGTSGLLSVASALTAVVAELALTVAAIADSVFATLLLGNASGDFTNLAKVLLCLLSKIIETNSD